MDYGLYIRFPSSQRIPLCRICNGAGVRFFIFVWNNMEKSSELIEDFVRAVHIFFVITTVFCLFCRPEAGELRYSGFSKNPSVFALYLGTCWAIVLGELEQRIRKGNKIYKVLPFVAEGCLVMSFCWKSQSACPLLTMVGIAFLWLVKVVRNTRHRETRKGFIAVIISVCIFIVPIYGGLTWGLNNIPESLGTEITFEGEEVEAKINFGNVVYAAEETDRSPQTRLEQKFSSSTLSLILSGRDYYYRTYLRDMNLWGHKERPEMWGGRRLPHNAVLGIAHRYGVFAAVPYILMLLAVVIGTFKYAKKNVKYASIPFFVCVSSIVMSMADNVEQPFIWLPWIGLYLIMGCAFVEN